MKSEPLDYASRKYWRPDIHRLIALAIVFVLPVLILAGLTVEVRQTESRIDAVTGTMQRQTTWFGVKGKRVIEVSPLETRLKKSGIPWSPTWCFLSDVHYTLFGNVTCRGCSPAPPIFMLKPVQQQFSDASTDKDLRCFVKVMQSGTQAEQRAALDAITNKDWYTPAIK